jgi:peptidylprolyl isomerase
MDTKAMMKLPTKVFFILLVLSLTACFGPDKAIKQTDNFIVQQNIDKTDNDWKTQLSQPELLQFSKDKTYLWLLETSQGNLTIELFHEVAPMHVTSTIYLTQLGFYNDLTFHRVIPGFMAQGGDPIGNDRGNPGYKYQGEFDSNTGHSGAGILSMANSGPNTDGSQFFITFKATPFLNNRHTVFGQVIDDLDDTLSKIEKLGQKSGRTKKEIKIISAKIKIEDNTTTDKKTNPLAVNQILNNHI